MTYFPMLFQENPSQNSCMYIMGEKRNEFFLLYITEPKPSHHCEWKIKSLYCIYIYVFFLCIDGKREEKKEKEKNE